MAAEREQSSQKLVYLKDRTHRPRARKRRPDRGTSNPSGIELASEGLWLSRTLLVAAAGLALHWLGIASGVGEVGDDAVGHWATANVLPRLLLSTGAVLAARAIGRRSVQGPLLTSLVAGGMVFLALQGLSGEIVGGDFGDPSLQLRTGVLLQTAALAIGVWAASWSLRSVRSSPE